MRFLKTLMVLVLLCAGAVWFLVYAPYGPSTETFVEIAPGTGTAGIAEQMQQAGIIRSKLAFEALKEWRGGSLKAGEYRFDHPAPLLEVSVCFTFASDAPRACWFLSLSDVPG